MQEKGSIIAGMAEVSVDKIVALERSVTDKDQLIGALREQVKHLEEDIKERVAEKQKDDKVLIVKKKTIVNSPRRGFNPFYVGDYDNEPSSEIEEIVGTRNLDTVVETIRKEEAKKLGLKLSELEAEVNSTLIEKNKLKNDYEYKLRVVEDDLKYQRKNNEKDVNDAKERIRKHMTELITGLNEEIEELNDELRKVKKDKTDEAVEEARKQEIIDLKNRIAELEALKDFTPELGWFKTIIYNWLKVDMNAKVKAERENLEKQERTNKISNNYPDHKSWWAPSWMHTGSFGYGW